MSDRDELAALRRLAELEAKASGKAVPNIDLAPDTEPKTGMLQNLSLGAFKGAADIGTTLMKPLDALGNMTGISDITNDERRQQIGDFFNQYADTDSTAFKGGELASNIAGTAGAGGVLGKAAGAALKAIPAGAKYAPQVISALESGGLRLGTAPATSMLGKVGNTALRAGSGAAVGGASAGLINPEYTGTGATLGGILPAGAWLAGKAGEGVRTLARKGSEKLMQSALKPTIAELRNGNAATAVRTMLDEGVNASRGGVDKMQGLVAGLNDQISDAISGSNANLSKQRVLSTLGDTNQRFSTQVSPTSDLASIQRVADDFSAHPMLPKDEIPVSLAQELKKGTYRILKGKYGEVGSAETEAQKALARGLKEGIAEAVPEVAPLNARESRLLSALSVAERRALMRSNNNPLGLAALAHDPRGLALFMADKNDLLKSLGARGLNQVTKIPKVPDNKLLADMLRTGLITSEASP